MFLCFFGSKSFDIAAVVLFKSKYGGYNATFTDIQKQRFTGSSVAVKCVSNSMRIEKESRVREKRMSRMISMNQADLYRIAVSLFSHPR